MAMRPLRRCAGPCICAVTRVWGLVHFETIMNRRIVSLKRRPLGPNRSPKPSRKYSKVIETDQPPVLGLKHGLDGE